MDGGRDNKALKDEAKQAGISEPTLRRAKARLNIRVKKVGAPGSHYQRWVWELPEGDQPYAEDDQGKESDHLRASGTDKRTYSQHLAEDDQSSITDHLRAESLASSQTSAPLNDEEALSDEEIEFAAHLEYYSATREEADATARRMFQDVSF